MLVFASVCSDRVRHFVLSVDGATGIKSDIAMRPLPADIAYPILNECYLSLRQDYENGAAPPDQRDAAMAFERAFAGFRGGQWRSPDMEAEKARHKAVFIKTFGSFSLPKEQ